LTTDLVRRYAFCCTFPIPGVAAWDGGRYPPPRPVEPGLSSPWASQAATVRPTRRRMYYTRRERFMIAFEECHANAKRKQQPFTTHHSPLTTHQLESP